MQEMDLGISSLRNHRLKCSKVHVRNLKEGELVCLVDGSEKRVHNKVGHKTQGYTDDLATIFLV